MCGCCAGGAEGHWGSSAPFQEPSCLSVPILVLSPEGEGDAELRTLGVQCGGIAWHPFPPPSFPGGHHADPAPCHVFQRVHTHPGQRSHVWVRPLHPSQLFPSPEGPGGDPRAWESGNSTRCLSCFQRDGSPPCPSSPVGGAITSPALMALGNQKESSLLPPSPSHLFLCYEFNAGTR